MSKTPTSLAFDAADPARDLLKRRIEARTLVSDRGCMEWQGYANEKGYGRMSVKRQMVLVHRLSYALNVGPVPDGMFVLHRCDNSRCANPNHLYLGTDTENTRDKVERHRLLRGARAPGAKLKESHVRAILADPRTHRLIALDYGVAPSTIDQIKSGKSWQCIRAVDQLISEATHLATGLQHLAAKHAEAMRQCDSTQPLVAEAERAAEISRGAERFAFVAGQLSGFASSSIRNL